MVGRRRAGDFRCDGGATNWRITRRGASGGGGLVAAVCEHTIEFHSVEPAVSHHMFYFYYNSRLVW